MKTFLAALSVALVCSIPLYAAESGGEKYKLEAYSEEDYQKDIEELDKKVKDKNGPEYASAKGRLIARMLETVAHVGSYFDNINKKNKEWVRAQKLTLDALCKQGGEWAILPSAFYLYPIDKDGNIPALEVGFYIEGMDVPKMVRSVQSRRFESRFIYKYKVGNNDYRLILPNRKADEKGAINIIGSKGQHSVWIAYINSAKSKEQEAKLEINLAEKKDSVLGVWINGQKLEKFKEGKSTKIKLLPGTNSLIFTTLNEGEIDITTEISVKGNDLSYGAPKGH